MNTVFHVEHLGTGFTIPDAVPTLESKIDFHWIELATLHDIDPCNSNEAMHEIAADLQEGADMIMVKPGLPYLDIVRRAKDTFAVPTYAYHVSGEYAMIKAAAAQGWINEREIVMETMMAFRRAGCDGVLTYCAHDVATWLKSD
jgi:porphobilinogen synthase